MVFMQGCYLRCHCCHNPDTWSPNGGTAYTATEVAVPKPYTLSVERDRTAIYITNTYNGPPPPPPPDLPPTGQLWWPVPVLLALGICSLALGTCYGSRQRRASR